MLSPLLAVMNIQVTSFCLDICLHVSWEDNSEVKLLSHRVNLYLTFSERAKLFSKVA